MVIASPALHMGMLTQQPIDGDAPKLDRAQRRAGSLGLLRHPAEICS
jgi:hypothetical protein